ncbi:helix-turn-helix domain-containing protein [Leptospira sp. GIMC2001]|uniref:helix-turn-helix domain-containing protein n=1 Tax=Leptospira sp. GIMC2001 TaxID=1513297 RepID=UPI00234BCCB3|nr:helix-turn-helix domain-containing protein [Leptospira sp. GIMC2001]WCL51481.1 helix-turn-helix domain-containing protein [Leptospira sp. GIMC2001]
MRTGIWIPEWVNELGLTGNAKQLYAEIVSLHFASGCFASNEHFAKVLGLKADTISRMISSLKKKGLVVQSSFDGRRRTLMPLRIGASSIAEPEVNQTQTRTNVQERVGKEPKPELEIPSSPVHILKVQKKENKFRPSNSNISEWESFLLFAKRLSSSTGSRIGNYTKPEDLPPDLRVYYDRFQIAA